MSAIFLLNLIAKINNLLIAEGETRLKFENHVTKWHSTLPSISLAEWNARCIAWIFECHNWKKHTQVKPSMEIPMKITWKYPWSWKFPCNKEIRRMPELVIVLFKKTHLNWSRPGPGKKYAQFLKGGLGDRGYEGSNGD